LNCSKTGKKQERAAFEAITWHGSEHEAYHLHSCKKPLLPPIGGILSDIFPAYVVILTEKDDSCQPFCKR
jgi:hypothetical protein